MTRNAVLTTTMRCLLLSRRLLLRAALDLSRADIAIITVVWTNLAKDAD